MAIMKHLLASYMLLAGVTAFGVMPPNSRLAANTSSILPPSRDPFYTAPAGYESAAPGAILRVRKAQGNLTSIIANSSAAYNILYRTTDSLYQPSWAVTTLLVPVGDRNNALLSYQIPTDSADIDAATSYALYSAPPADIALALGQGWYVNTPDYEGPKASFTAGVQSGHATLDSIRAVLNSDYGLAPDAKYAMWGYSGGALASEWAAELSVQYAPELNISGVALGGLTPNITSVLLTITGTLYAGLGPAGIVGISSQFPELRQFILENLNPTGMYNRSTFLGAVNQTLRETITTFYDQDLTKYFVDGVASLQNPISQKYTTRDGLMGYHGVPPMPVFAYKAIGDEISVIADTDALVDRYCAAGANIWYQRNTVGGHLAEQTNGDPRAFEWLTAVFDGIYDMPGCKIENVTVGTDTSNI